MPNGDLYVVVDNPNGVDALGMFAEIPRKLEEVVEASPTHLIPMYKVTDLIVRKWMSLGMPFVTKYYRNVGDIMHFYEVENVLENTI